MDALEVVRKVVQGELSKDEALKLGSLKCMKAFRILEAKFNWMQV